jgi:hypothetical protein
MTEELVVLARRANGSEVVGRGVSRASALVAALEGAP